VYAAYAITALSIAAYVGALTGLGRSALITRLGLLVAPMIIAELVLQRIVQRRFLGFSARMIELLPQEPPERLLELYRRETFLRFAAPKHLMLDLLGMIYVQLGEHRSAAASFREALEAAPAKAQVELAIKLAASLKEAGDLLTAERYYREVIAVAEDHVPSLQQLARLVLQRRDDLREATELLHRAAASAPRDVESSQLRGELALLLVRQGKLDDAERQINVALHDLRDAGDDQRMLVEEAAAALATARSETASTSD